MTREQAVSLAEGAKITYRGAEAAFVRLLPSMRAAIIATGTPTRPKYAAVLISEIVVL